MCLFNRVVVILVSKDDLQMAACSDRGLWHLLFLSLGQLSGPLGEEFALGLLLLFEFGALFLSLIVQVLNTPCVNMMRVGVQL